MNNGYEFKEKIEYKLFENKIANKDKKKLKIFGEEFVKNNDSNFTIIYKDMELILTPFLELSDAEEDSIIEITLKLINPVTNISKMFFECENLYSFPGFANLNTEKITDISSLFRNCIHLNKLQDISNWNTSKINNMSYLFSGCININSLPDISKWDTSNVTNFSYMFRGCEKIFELPDISKWNTSKCIKMNNMFQGCSNLSKLPDINKWNISSVNSMSNMFYGCCLIQNLPDISIWNTENVEDMSSMFYFCSGLNILPDLNMWNVTNLKNKSNMFAMCKSTLNYPAFLIFDEQKNDSNDNNIKIENEEKNQKLNLELLSFSSKSYLCCPKCKGIPEIMLPNNDDNDNAFLLCDFCGLDEAVKISQIINLSSNWINKVLYKCNFHKESNEAIDASKYCSICEKFLCKKCEVIHQKENENESHILDDIFDLDTHFCEKHSSKIINFCETCDEYICNICLENGHYSHNICDKDKDRMLNLNYIRNFQATLTKRRLSKIRILENIEKNFDKNKFDENDLDIKYKILELNKKEIKEIDDFKKLGKIIYFTSKKIKSGKHEQDILNNYYNIFNYIFHKFSEENIKKFARSLQKKIDEYRIGPQNLSKKEKDFLIENVKKMFRPIPEGLSDFYKKKEFIENNIDFSRLLKKYIIMEKYKNPDNYVDIDKVLNSDDIYEKINSNDPEFILSLIGKCAQNNGTEVYITKKPNEEIKDIEFASIQSLFSLVTQNKYTLHFKFDDETIEQTLANPQIQEDFLKTYKLMILKELDFYNDNLIFRDIHRGSLGVTCSLIESSEQTDNAIQKLKGKFKIEEVEERPILEALQISSNILAPEGNRFAGWGLNEKRGGEKYIPPLNYWRGLGLKVSKKYDNGDDSWLGYKNKKGEFAIAYMGLSNFLGDNDKAISGLNMLLSKKLFRKEVDFRNTSKKGIKICGDGICLFQNPEYAENSAGIIYICGYQIKVLLMCRINPKKIRQPENFRDCWILNPTPDEIRPYRILIKIIPNSPLTDGSSITISREPVDYILEILKSNDSSFFKHRGDYTKILLEKHKNVNYETLSNSIFAIKFYTAEKFYQMLNNYLRDKETFKEDEKLFPEKHIKSYIFCLQTILKKIGQVKDGTKVYRGVKNFKLDENIGIGSEFYFREFISTSLNKKVALRFINGKEKNKKDVKGTLFKIIIKNNQKRNYCCDVSAFSQFKSEKEILISSLCYYKVIKIKRNEKGIDKINLNCEGFLLDELLNNTNKDEDNNNIIN